MDLNKALKFSTNTAGYQYRANILFILNEIRLHALMCPSGLSTTLDILVNEPDPTSSPGKGRRQRVVKSRLPKELQGLMGEANLKFARGEYEEVMVMCKEIIRSG